MKTDREIERDTEGERKLRKVDVSARIGKVMSFVADVLETDRRTYW